MGATPEQKLKQNQRYYARVKDQPGFREKRAKYQRQFRLADKQRTRNIMNRYRAKLKKLAFAAYGAFCSCCGETERVFLTLDHVNGDGAAHRREIGTGNLLKWAKKNKFPPSLRILCFNCNAGRHWNGGVCPHEKNSKLRVRALV